MNQNKVPPQAILVGANLALRRSIEAADASPFLGHHALDPGQHDRVTTVVRSIVNGDAERFVGLFRSYSLLCAWLMVKGLAEEYAQDGTANVYRPIARILGAKEVPNSVRPPLNIAFRRACLRSGLALPPRLEVEQADYVSDYIVQAGVAHSQLESLAEAFHKAHARLGPPPIDDTHRLQHWSCEAVEFAHPGLVRLRRVIYSDSVGYHATIFEKLASGDTAISPFERSFSKAIQATRAGSRSTGSMPPREPALTFRDGELAVENTGQTYSVVLLIDGRERFLSSGARHGLNAPWPESITWRFTDKSGSENLSRLNIIDADEVLIFDGESGALLRRVTQEMSNVALEAPSVFIVARKPFCVDDEEGYDLGGAYAYYASLEAPINLHMGGRSIQLSLVQRPRLLVDGRPIASSGGSPLVMRPTRVRIFADPDTLREALVVRIEHPAMAAPIDAPVMRGDDGAFFANLEMLPESGPLGPFRMSLNLKTQQRAIARTRVWLWPGLRDLLDGMIFDADIPSNFDINASSHIEKSAIGRLELAGGGNYLSAVLAFKLPNNERISFTFARPGLVLSIAPTNGPERPVEAGTSLVLSDGLDGSLVIRSSDSKACLDICGRHETEPFAATGIRRISLASLLISDGHNEVRYWPKGDERQGFQLVRVVPSTTPRTFKWSQHAEIIEIESRFLIPVDAVRLNLTHMATGQVLTLDAAVGRRPVAYSEAEAFSATQYSADRSDLRMRLDRRSFFEGIWLAEISIRAEGKDEWRPVINERLDEFSFAFDGCGTRAILRDGATTVFSRLNTVLSRCFAPETWPSVGSVLVPQWKELGASLIGSEAGRVTLMAAAGQGPAAFCSPSWIPIHHPLEIAPDLFEAPPHDFVAFTTGSAEGSEHLARMSKLAECQRIRDARETLNVGLAFFLGFENLMHAQRSDRIRLKGFMFNRYAQASELDSDEEGTFWNTSRDWLTRAHHSWCCARAYERIQRVAPPGSRANEQRLPGVTRFAQVARTQIGLRYLRAPEHLSEDMALVEAMPAALSAFARACRHRETSPFLKPIAERTERSMDEALRNVAFLIRLAPELFAFYMIFWTLVTTSETR